MSMIYRATISFSTWRITYESHKSMDDAIYHCHRQAHEKGEWEPRKLREKWWQIFRPKEHNEIEKRFLLEQEAGE